MIDDAVLRGLLDEWVDDFDRNYEGLVAGVGEDCLEHAEIAFEAVALESDKESVTGLQSPAAVTVNMLLKGDADTKELVATQNVVTERGAMPQPDGIRAEAGDRWRVLGHRLGDGTVMPCRGTYRLARSRIGGTCRAA